MSKNYRQLTMEQRLSIEINLREGFKSFQHLGEKIGVSATTVSREIRKHLTVVPEKPLKNGTRPCAKRAEGCKVSKGCSMISCKNQSCAKCSLTCGPNCNYYEPIDCDKREQPPYVCNGCKKRRFCNYKKHYYYAKTANNEALTLRSEARIGFNLTEEEVVAMEEHLKPLVVDGGFSPHAAIVTVGEEKLGCSERSIYTYIDNGVFKSIINLNLPRKVRYRPRKGVKKKLKVDKKCRIGRSYEDYKAFIASMGWSEKDVPVVQMDSVEGRKGCGDKCLLTLHFVKEKFQLAFIRERNDSASVIAWLREIKRKVGKDTFKRLFPVILTDNGTEFSNPTQIEFDEETGERLTYIFYCDPSNSQQKGACENNHEMIRRIIPKGTELDFSQEKMELMMAHINSYPRRTLNDKTPFECFEFMFGKEVLEKLGIVRIEKTKIILKPSLLRD